MCYCTWHIVSNPFHGTGLFQYPIKTSENLWRHETGLLLYALSKAFQIPCVSNNHRTHKARKDNNFWIVQYSSIKGKRNSLFLQAFCTGSTYKNYEKIV